MSITIAYHATSVGPVCRRIAACDDRILVVHDDELRAADVMASQTIQQPAPVDPCIEAWERTMVAADAVRQRQQHIITREDTQTVRTLSLAAEALLVTLAVPAPVAPPPVPAERHVLIRWGSQWRGDADITINTARSVSIARNKKQSRQFLTGLCPTTWYVRGAIQVPCVIRPRRHHAARRFFVCYTMADVPRAIARCGLGWYASELIDKANEYRVFVLQGRVIRISEKLPPTVGEAANDVAWNLANGGHSRTLKRKAWPLAVAVAAIQATQRVGLDWSAVDVAVDRSGRVVVFEANTAPGLTNQNTIEQIAWAFASVVEHPTLPPLYLTAVGTWKDLIHPSLRPEVTA